MILHLLLTLYQIRKHISCIAESKPEVIIIFVASLLVFQYIWGWFSPGLLPLRWTGFQHVFHQTGVRNFQQWERSPGAKPFLWGEIIPGLSPVNISSKWITQLHEPFCYFFFPFFFLPSFLSSLLFLSFFAFEMSLLTLETNLGETLRIFNF